MKPIVFDFDGVITKRGEALKEEAWEQLLVRHDPPEHTTNEAWSHALREARAGFGSGRGKGSRVDIIAKALTDTGAPTATTDPSVVLWSQRYDAVVQAMIVEEGIYPETREALLQLSSAGHALYVNTATPTDAVVRSLEALGMRDYFVGVYGRPQSKLENLTLIAEHAGVSMAELVFVGDGEGDEEAAREAGCRFVGVANDYNKWEGKPYPLIRRLTELVGVL